jgi:hypothetical protein
MKTIVVNETELATLWLADKLLGCWRGKRDCG